MTPRDPVSRRNRCKGIGRNPTTHSLYKQTTALIISHQYQLPLYTMVQQIYTALALCLLAFPTFVFTSPNTDVFVVEAIWHTSQGTPYVDLEIQTPGMTPAETTPSTTAATTTSTAAATTPSTAAATTPSTAAATTPSTTAATTLLTVAATTPSTAAATTPSVATTPSTAGTTTAATTTPSAQSTASLVPIPGAPEPGYPLICYGVGFVTNSTLQYHFAQDFVYWVNGTFWSSTSPASSFLYKGGDGTIYQFDIRWVLGCSAEGHIFYTSTPTVYGLYEQCKDNQGGGGEITQNCVTIAYYPNAFVLTS